MNRSLLMGAALLTLALAAGTPRTADAFRWALAPPAASTRAALPRLEARGMPAAMAGPGMLAASPRAERPITVAASPAKAGMGPATGAAPGMATAGTRAAITLAASMARPWSTAIVMALRWLRPRLSASPPLIGSLVASVPAGCPYQYVNGANYYVCGGTWHQPYYGATVSIIGRPAALTQSPGAKAPRRASRQPRPTRSEGAARQPAAPLR